MYVDDHSDSCPEHRSSYAGSVESLVVVCSVHSPGVKSKFVTGEVEMDPTVSFSQFFQFPYDFRCLFRPSLRASPFHMWPMQGKFFEVCFPSQSCSLSTKVVCRVKGIESVWSTELEWRDWSDVCHRLAHSARHAARMWNAVCILSPSSGCLMNVCWSWCSP